MLEITIQRRVDGGWPIVAERHKAGTMLPVRSEGRLELADEPSSSVARTYGTTLGQMLFRDAVRDAFVQARSDQPDGVRVLVFVEAEELKGWRWEWLCAPVGGTTWDFLSLDQRVRYSLYLPSLTDRAYPPIGRNDLRALVVVANPADPDKRYGLASFDVGQNVARLRSIFGERTPATVLARVAGAAGAPTLDAIETHLTGATPDRPYTILHLVCHGWFNPNGEGKTTLYLERPSPDPASGQVLAQPVQGSELIARLRRVGRLPYLVFLSTCESAAPEAEQRLGGLAQRLVRELGIPAVIGMTERVTIATAHALAEQFYNRLFAQTKAGEVDRALVEAYAGLAARSDINVPALYSRLGTQPLFSTALDRPLTVAEIKAGLRQLDELLIERAPVLRPRLVENAGRLQSMLETSRDALSGTARQERDQALTRANELCSEAVEISFHALAQGEQPPAYDARQPFRGLSPFRAEDREFFFGRDSLVEKLEKKLSADNFLAVLGPSGSGKSSLVLAGLAPKLKAQMPGLQVVDDLTPGSSPLEQLRVRQSRLGPGPILYIVDQFEELFTLCKDEDQRSAFIDELLNLAQSHRVVLTMRADFWGECARYAALKDRMLARQELIAPMMAAELRSAMEQQAAKVGLRFEADLSNSMLDEVAGEPGAMPLLQHALLELWKRRHGRWLRAEEYRAIGGVKQAIAETADRLYNEASAAEQDGIRDIFVRLTQIDDNVVRGEERRDTRRRLSLAEVLPAGSDPGQIRALVKRLADNVLVVTSRNELTEQEELEVSHEALIRHWARLRKWLDDDLIGLRLRDRVSDAVREWNKNRADESLLVHRGSRLAAAEELLINRRLPFTAEERDYLKRCREAETAQLGKERAQLKATVRQQRHIAWLLSGVIVLLAGSILGILAWVNQPFITQRWNRYWKEGPYQAANFKEFVLKLQDERALKPGDPFRECKKDCPKMIVVPPGEFMMGSPVNEKDRRPNEGPQHLVTIDRPFAVSIYDVTFDDWEACVSVGGCPREGGANDHGWGKGDQPVINVNWEDAQKYVAWLSRMTGKEYRLLSEAEWEYAARAGTTTAFYWGDELDKQNANCHRCENRWSKERTSPVGSFDPNPWGLFDMAGNVWQWVTDCDNADYNGAPIDGNAWTTGHCEKRIVRGASWYYYPADPRSAYRYADNKDDRNYNTGFRVARTLAPSVLASWAKMGVKH